jgi:hypothetical protein
MRLLENLGLRVSKNVANAIAAKAAASAAKGPPADRHVTATAQPADRHAAGSKAQGTRADDDSDAARKAALALKAQIEHHLKTKREEWSKLTDAEPKVAKLVAAATGAQKKDLEDKKKKLEQRIAVAQKEIDELDKDAEALDNPGTKNEEYVAILARHKAAARVAKSTEVDLHEENLSKKKGEKHETTTTTSYADGAAVVDKTEMTFEKGSVKTEDERKTKVSTTGKLTHEHKKSIEVEHADGKKTTLEKSTEVEVSKEGVGASKTTTISNRDGSSTSEKKSGGVERGEGKLGAVYGKDTTRTDASGTATTRGAKGKGGMVAGKDGYGGFGEGTASVSRERPSGVKTGAVAGLNANVVCNIGEPKGDPPVYTVTLEVNLGASLAVSAGHAKKDGPASAGIEAKAGKTVFMKCEHRLSASEAAEYMKALEAASSGGTAAATHKEFAIIHAGVKQGWAVAQQLYTGRANALDAAALDNLKKGDSVEVGGGTSVGGKAKVAIKAVSLEGGVEQTDDHSAKVTRGEDGELDYELKGSSKSTRSGKVGVSSGAVEGSIGGSHTAATSTGYLIHVDPKKDAGGKLRQALAACKSQADYDAFAKAHPETVTEKTVGKSVADTQAVSLGVGGVKAGIHLGTGVADEMTTDGKGNLKHRKITGTASAGGAIEIGGTKIGDSVDDEAEAEIDGEGNASIDLRRKRTSTDLGKLVRSKVPLLGEKKTGALAKAAGGAEEDEVERKASETLHLSSSDFDALGKMACANFNKWMHGATSPRALDDWKKAGRAIVAAGGDRRVVATEISRFVGGDNGRLDMVNYFLRPDGKVSVGTRYEFPEGLEKLKKDYEALVVGDPVAPIDAVLKKEGAEKAGAFGKTRFDSIEKLNQAITAAKNFSQPAVRAEMLSAVNSRKSQVLAKMREIAGARSAEAERADHEAEYRRLLKTCLQYKLSQDDMFAKIKELHHPGSFRNVDVIIPMFKQLRDLHAIWTPDWNKAGELRKALGDPEATWKDLRPNLEELDRWEHAVRIQG